MKIYLSHQLLLFKRLMLVLFFMMLSRIIFYFINYHLFSSLSAIEVLLHFFYGLRFDIAAISLVNLVCILLSIVPANILVKTWYQKVLKYLFISTNLIMLSFNAIDFKFYEFEGKRLTADFFNKEWLGNDFFNLLPQFFIDYWYLFILFAGIISLFVWLYPTYKKPQDLPQLFNFKWLILQILLGVVILSTSVVLGRGGFQLKPISVITAARYTTPENMALILNSPFTIIKTFGRQTLSNPKYFSDSEVEKMYPVVHQNSENLPMDKKNVVLIILESFGKEYSGFLNNKKETFTPQLDSIMQLGLTCTQAYANGKRSIEALPSIISGIPSLMDNAFITSSFTSMHIESLGSLLKKEGYYTAFYHGGKNGTMGFDSFINLAGINIYKGAFEYPEKSDNDGDWGIKDEPYLQYFCREISILPEPFFVSVFTLSSHHPYNIPIEFQGKFPKGNLINLESIGYGDYSLGRFFHSAAKEPWFQNTLFVLCADHTAQASGEFYKSNMGKFAIPIVFYSPSDTLMKGFYNETCQQTDITPSVLDYLNYQKPFIAFGQSIFDAKTPKIAVSYTNGIYQIIKNQWVINFNGKQIISVEQNVDGNLQTLDRNLSNTEIVEIEQLVKAYIQQYNTRLQHNKMVVSVNQPK